MKGGDTSIKDWVELCGPEKMALLRNAAHPPGKQGLWIAKYCDDAQIAELYFRIFENDESLKKISRMVRGVWGIQPEWTLQQFERGLEKWRKRLETPLSRLKKLDKKAAVQVTQDIAEIGREVDALRTLGWAISIQKERLQMLVELERRTRHPMKFTDDVQSVLCDQLKSYTAIGIKLGAFASIPDEVNVNIKADADFVMTHLIENDGQKMIKAATKFLEEAKKQCVTYYFDEKEQAYLPASERKRIERD